MPGGEQIVAPATTLYDDGYSLCLACLVLAHEKAIYQRYRDGDEGKNVNWAGRMKDEKAKDVEEQQNYKDYPGHFLIRPIGITFECVRMIAEFPNFFN